MHGGDQLIGPEIGPERPPEELSGGDGPGSRRAGHPERRAGVHRESGEFGGRVSVRQTAAHGAPVPRLHVPHPAQCRGQETGHVLAVARAVLPAGGARIDLENDEDDTTSDLYWAYASINFNKKANLQLKLERASSDLWDEYYRGRARFNISF